MNSRNWGPELSFELGTRPELSFELSFFLNGEIRNFLRNLLLSWCNIVPCNFVPCQHACLVREEMRQREGGPVVLNRLD